MTKKEILKAVELHSKILEEEGILVLDKITRLPEQGEPFISHNLVIGLNTGGSAKVEYDTQPIDFLPNDMFVLMPKHTINILNISDDFQLMVVVVSPEKFDRMKHDYPVGYQENLRYHQQAHIHLTKDQAENMQALMKVLHSVCWSNSTRKLRHYHHLLEAMFTLLQDYSQASGAIMHKPSPHEMILAHFIDAVMEHYAESREVRFYANLFCLSPKHFSAIIKQQSGKNASDWISSYVIAQSKNMLCYQHQLSIQQISLRLGFPDQAAFARYFKTYTGMSAREFRDKRQPL